MPTLARSRSLSLSLSLSPQVPNQPNAAAAHKQRRNRYRRHGLARDLRSAGQVTARGIDSRRQAAASSL